MTSRWRWIIRLLFRRIWLRAALFSLCSVALALLAAFVAPYIPDEISAKVGSNAVDNILGILASSMLAVTTFSLTAMVSAFSGAASTLTPRATQLLVEDTTAQNALSTFLGAFLFAIVGICALSTGIYGASGRVILFVGTLVVIAIIVVTLLRWIGHLSSFGRVGSTIERVEKAAMAAVSRAGYPVAVTRPQAAAMKGGRRVFARRIGYVTHVDLRALEAVARRHDCAIDVQVRPGAFVTPHRALARIARAKSDLSEPIQDAFTIDDRRQFDHDPRLGLIVLSEIASRALSPGINDPGTAIAVLGSGVRVITALLKQRAPDLSEGLVKLPALDIDDLLDDLVRPIARDGARIIEVALKLQRSLAEIAVEVPAAYGTLAVRAADALVRCEAAMDHAPDLDCTRAAFRAHWTDHD